MAALRAARDQFAAAVLEGERLHRPRNALLSSLGERLQAVRCGGAAQRRVGEGPRHRGP